MIYKKDANDVWNGVQRLRASDIRIGDRFGSDVAVDGDFLVVGARYQDYDENNTNQVNSAGAAYVYKKGADDIWTETQKIVPSHRGYGDDIGKSVSIHGDYITLASKSDTDAANVNTINGNGSVFVFKKDADDFWAEVQKLKPGNGVQYSEFGYGDVSISEDYIAVGAKNLDLYDDNWYYGHVYLFKKDGDGVWNESQIIRTPYPASNFGSGVSLDNNLLLVSAPNSSVENNGSNISNVGLSYLFLKNANDEWVLAETIQASQVVANSYIGGGQYDATESTYAVAVDNNHFILGAQPTTRIVDNTTYYNAGTAYISGNVEDLGLLDVLDVEDNLLGSVKLYPNPIKNKLNIHLTKTYTNIKVYISNILGKTFLEKEFKNLNNIKIDFNFPKGIYLTKITLENKSAEVVKLIKN
ncbi:T9SS type A sorting domain-containing protein [Polaribacter sp. MSW13]|uniref:T9SS type A sorting domain-containing protein n=1 Tax=Polaribacter marinus TaxID=2916838 RepID=A0A9X1VME9_9FLAO|nr:T9SS type A sorting domain-containing protein [Polaribacter marinus]MCI2228797.1 T9SS type A sorting domain-containing protein [Polaribacter marinus]